MNKKSNQLFYIFISLFLVFFIEIIYISSTKSITTKSLEKKQLFVSLTKLPDIAIYSENIATRHRSLSTVFSIYNYDGNLREYSPSSYIISYSHIENK